MILELWIMVMDELRDLGLLWIKLVMDDLFIDTRLIVDELAHG